MFANTGIRVRTKEHKFTNRSCRVTAVAVAMSFFFGTANFAIADYSHCVEPTAISPPAELFTDQEVNEWREKVENHSADVALYLQCLATYAEKNEDAITTDELDRMRATFSKTADQSRQVADAWNRAYSSYNQKYADSER